MSQRYPDGRDSLSILCVITAMGCGGAERRIAWLAQELSGLGHHVVLGVLHGRTNHFENDESVDVRFFEEDHAGGSTAPGRFFGRLRWLRDLMAEIGPNVVLSFIDVANVMTLLSARGIKMPVVVAERAYPPLSWIPWYYRVLRRWLYRSAEAVVVQTDEAAHWVQRSVPGQRVEVIPNPVPPPSPDSSVESPFPLPTGPKIVAMGRLAPEKGFDLLIAAFAEIADRHPDWALLILGEGPERSHLLRNIDSRGLQGRVLLPGQVSKPEPVLRACDVFVLSSRHEGFPNALCEAMACGLPPVSFDCPVGPRNIIRDGIDGVLVPAGDVPALASELSRLMADHDSRDALAARAVEVVSRFEAEAITGEWEQLLQSVAVDNRSGVQ